MWAEGRLFREVALVTQRAVDLVGADLVVAYAGAPRRIAGLVPSRHPSATGSIQQVLRAQDVGQKEELRVLDAAIYVALSSEVDHVVELVTAEEVVHKSAVADVAADEDAAFVVDVPGDGAEVARIGQGIENDYADMLVYPQDVLNIIGADESGGAGHEISLHIISK